MGRRAVRIGVDGFNLAMPDGTGIATYAAELVEVLHEMGHGVDGVFGIPVPTEPELRQAAFFDRYRRVAPPPRRIPRWRRPWHRTATTLRAFGPHPMREVRRNANVVTTADGVAAIPAFDRLHTAGRLFEDALTVFGRTGRFTTVRLPAPPEVMHWTYPLPLRVAGARNVYTLHDLVPLKLPYTTLDDKRLYARLIEGCVRHAACIGTVSEASRHDILELTGANPDRVVNTYQSSGRASPPSLAERETDARAVQSMFGVGPRGYFLYFGAIEPKKNVGRLIEAYLRMRSETPLVVVGARSWQGEGELQLIPGGGASGAAGTFHGPCGQRILRLDYLSRDRLAKLVAGAKAVVFPSLYEGFGLPVLEAMQAGTPVVTSCTSSLPEIVGDAGILVDPYDVDALEQAMRRVDEDASLCRSLSARGQERAVMFSRPRYGERLSELYGRAMAAR